jgi:hypothetical protein
LTAPFLRQGEKLGFKDLFDIGSLKIPFWWNGVLTREAIVKAKRPLLLKFARAMMDDRKSCDSISSAWRVKTVIVVVGARAQSVCSYRVRPDRRLAAETLS